MKRWLFLILTALLLVGCTAEPEATSVPTEATEVAATSPMEPTGYYDPDSSLEASTDGAIRVYPLNRTDSYGLVSMGSDLLLLSGSEFTTLTRLTGTTLYVSAAANLGCYIDADSPAFQAGSKGVTYYDELHRELVFLDTELKEVSRIPLPETILGEPALTADRKTIYYLTAETLRAIDLETNLDKLVKEIAFPSQQLTDLHLDDSILRCAVLDAYGNRRSLFISVKTGETVWESAGDLAFWSRDDRYFAVHADGVYDEFLTGTADGQPNCLVSDSYGLSAEAVMDLSSALVSSSGENHISLSLYDLETGIRTSAITLSGQLMPWGFQGDSSQNCLWFMGFDDDYSSDILCRWDLSKTPTGETSSTMTRRSTARDPDTEGLTACKVLADEISRKYGVEILLWTDAVAQEPDRYDLEPEHQVPVIRRCLELLDTALAKYPEGFLEQAASHTAGSIRICLVRSLTPLDTNLPEDTGGTQFWDESGRACVALSLSSPREQTVHHMLFHVIDSYVFTNCSVYDTWETLNPKGFSYTYSYNAQFEDASAFFETSDRAFLDLFSMTFPREDRARMMEYAMTAGNESCFQSETMQLKLRTLCHGIREAFGLKKSTESFPWEQYLSE